VQSNIENLSFCDIKPEGKYFGPDLNNPNATIQQGPDNRIYFTGFYSDIGGTYDQVYLQSSRYLSVIDKPNQVLSVSGSNEINLAMFGIPLNAYGNYNVNSFPNFNTNFAVGLPNDDNTESGPTLNDFRFQNCNCGFVCFTPLKAGIRFTWNFGDGTTLSGSNDKIPLLTHNGITYNNYEYPCHIYQAAGTYTVTLKVDNNLTITKVLTITNAPPALPNVSKGCATLPLPITNTFTVAPVANTTHLWETDGVFNGGNTGTTVSSTFTTMPYGVRVTSTNTVTGCVNALATTADYTQCDNKLATVLIGTYTTAPTFNANGYVLSGNVTLSGTYTLTNYRIGGSGANAKITIADGANITLNTCRLSGCTEMWGGIELKPSAKLSITGGTLIEDALVSVNMPNLNSTTTNALTVNNAIFNKNLIGIDFNRYRHNTAVPIFVNNAIFTSRLLAPICGGTTYPNWPTVASLQTTTTPADNLNTPFTALNNLTKLKLRNYNYLNSNIHINITDVGVTTGTIGTPTFGQSAIISSATPSTPNIYDNADIGINQTNSNLTTNFSVFMNLGSNGIRSLHKGKNIPQGISVPLIAEFSFTSSENRFYNCVNSSILASNFSRFSCQNSFFYSTLNNCIGIDLQGSNLRQITLNSNQIYNQNIGINIATNIGGKTVASSKGYGVTSISGNTFADKPAGNTSLNRYLNQAINCTSTGVTSFGFVNPFSNPNLNISSNTITNAFNGISVTNYNGVNNHSVRQQNNVIVLSYNAGATVQTGIASASNWNVYCRNNTVTGPALFTNATTPVSNSYNLTTQYSSLKPVIVNYQFGQNNGGAFNIVTCNKSQGGCIGFEFQQTQSNLKWFPLNEMNNQHYYGLLLNNGATFPAQSIGSSQGLDNKWNFTPSSANALQKHTYVYNSAKPGGTNATLDIRTPNNTIYYPGGLQPANNFNDAFPQNRKYEPSIGLLGNPYTITPTCLTLPVLPAIAPAFVPSLNNVALNSFPSPNNALQHTAVAQKNLFNMMKQDASYISASATLQNFYNVNNIPSSSFKKMYDLEEALSNEDYTLAQILIGSFGTPSELEQNTIQYADLYLQLVKDNLLTPTNKTNLFNLASLCPHTSGNIIYSARSLYNSIWPESYNVFHDNCDGPGLYKTASSNSDVVSEKFTAQIYPNPTDGVIYIITNSKFEDEISINITDITGKLINFTTCKKSRQICSVNLTNNAKGIFIIQVINKNNEKITEKVILQ
jgi:hypothetical protein